MRIIIGNLLVVGPSWCAGPFDTIHTDVSAKRFSAIEKFFVDRAWRGRIALAISSER
ncbi:MAG TPA: hypothetical protein VGO16_01845 [Pseudonocardiaceae bacterium]|nr:hypothetical protein [Pseudonocardiaceae bacterium]